MSAHSSSARFKMSSLQQPIHSGFNAASTAADVIQGLDLKGKTAIVTGGYSGLGLETVRVLLAAGAEVIVPARDVARAQAQMGEVKGAQVWPMDLLDPQSIDAFAERFLASHQALHILINNAGIETEGAYLDLDWPAIRENIEVNMIAPMALTYYVLPHMIAQ